MGDIISGVYDAFIIRRAEIYSVLLLFIYGIDSASSEITPKLFTQ